MTSSLRNSIHRRNHKERSQLSHRAKFGFLEKHQDYVKRARDYHSKQDRLTSLKQKAAGRNKDEFYFAMTREKTQGGVHVQDRGNVALPTDMVKLLKTQDENYIRTMRAAGLKKIDRLKSHLSTMVNLLDSAEDLDTEEEEVLLEAGVIARSRKRKGKGNGRHIVFVEDDATARSYTSPKPLLSSVPFSSSESSTPATDDLGWKASNVDTVRKRKSPEHLLDPDSDADNDMNITPLTSSDRRQLLRELAARLNRDRQLRYTEREFELQRLMMGKGTRKKLKGVELVGGGKIIDEDDEDALDARKGKPLVSTRQSPKTYIPRVYKWRAERKR